MKFVNLEKLKKFKSLILLNVSNKIPRVDSGEFEPPSYFGSRFKTYDEVIVHASRPANAFYKSRANKNIYEVLNEALFLSFVTETSDGPCIDKIDSSPCLDQLEKLTKNYLPTKYKGRLCDHKGGSSLPNTISLGGEVFRTKDIFGNEGKKVAKISFDSKNIVINKVADSKSELLYSLLPSSINQTRVNQYEGESLVSSFITSGRVCGNKADNICSPEEPYKSLKLQKNYSLDDSRCERWPGTFISSYFSNSSRQGSQGSSSTNRSN